MLMDVNIQYCDVDCGHIRNITIFGFKFSAINVILKLIKISLLKIDNLSVFFIFDILILSHNKEGVDITLEYIFLK